MKLAIRWWCTHPVAANLVMLLFIGGGILVSFFVHREQYPRATSNEVRIEYDYTGASSLEIESSFCTPIENSLAALDTVEDVSCLATDGTGIATVSVVDGKNVALAYDQISSAVDRIRNFPTAAKRPKLAMNNQSTSSLELVVYGDVSRQFLRDVAESTRREIQEIPGITQVNLLGSSPPEISVEISQEALKKYNISIETVAEKIRASSLDIPTGVMNTSRAQYFVRTKTHQLSYYELTKLPIVNQANGSVLTLGDIASIKRTYGDTEIEQRFNNLPSMRLSVLLPQEVGETVITNRIKNYLQKKIPSLPSLVNIAIWSDPTEMVDKMLRRTLTNAFLSSIIVVSLLGLFLNYRIAFWVAMGIPFSMLGAVLIFPVLGITLNSFSLVALIIVLGILVDDATVVSENTCKHMRNTALAVDKSVENGVYELSGTIVFSALTTAVTFSVMYFVPGPIGKQMATIPTVFILTLFLSLFESLFILPRHLLVLGEVENKNKLLTKLWPQLSQYISSLSVKMVSFYKRSLEFCLNCQVASLLFFFGILIVSLGLVAGGYVKLMNVPIIEFNHVHAKLRMSDGTSLSETTLVFEELKRSLNSILKEFDKKCSGEKITEGVYTSLNGDIVSNSRGPYLASVYVKLSPREFDCLNAKTLANTWQKRMRKLPGIERLDFAFNNRGNAKPIVIELADNRLDLLARASRILAAGMAEIGGVTEIESSLENGKHEVNIVLLPQARLLGFTEESLGRQVRAVIHGLEAAHIQSNGDELRLVVRYPAHQRKSLEDIKSLQLITNDGHHVLLDEIAKLEHSQGTNEIKRLNGRRIATISAGVDYSISDHLEILKILRKTVLNELERDYPGMQIGFRGEKEKYQDSVDSQKKAFLIILLVLYVLLAFPLRSYFQPILVLCLIPFGMVGAIWGHFILNMPLSIYSITGLMAVSGIVVNNSLILINTINDQMKSTSNIRDGVVQGTLRRLRPIFLTSITTSFGLFPMIFEKSASAQFLVFVAVSVSFGVLFSALVSIYLIPILYMFNCDFCAIFRKKWAGWTQLGRK